jgi:hypothetical protein
MRNGSGSRAAILKAMSRSAQRVCKASSHRNVRPLEKQSWLPLTHLIAHILPVNFATAGVCLACSAPAVSVRTQGTSASPWPRRLVHVHLTAKRVTGFGKGVAAVCSPRTHTLQHTSCADAFMASRGDNHASRVSVCLCSHGRSCTMSSTLGPLNQGASHSLSTHLPSDSPSQVLAVSSGLPIRTDSPVHEGKVRAVYWLTQKVWACELKQCIPSASATHQRPPPPSLSSSSSSSSLPPPPTPPPPTPPPLLPTR